MPILPVITSGFPILVKRVFSSFKFSCKIVIMLFVTFKNLIFLEFILETGVRNRPNCIFFWMGSELCADTSH